MDDEEGGPPARTRLTSTLAEIATNFSSRFPNFRCCSVCGTVDLFMLDRDEASFATRLFVYNGVQQTSNVHFKTTTLACATCGHLYQFLTEPLHRAIIEGDRDSPALP